MYCFGATISWLFENVYALNKRNIYKLAFDGFCIDLYECKKTKLGSPWFISASMYISSMS